MPAYYENDTGAYWLDNDSGWVKLNESALARHFRILGARQAKIPGELFSPVEKELHRVQLNHCIDFAGPIAGWKKGVYEMSGHRILVTSSPNLLVPAPGEWKLIEKCLTRLMATHPMQLKVLLSWLALGAHSLYYHDYIPGQILFLIGPAHCGKSFLQSLITWLFGGRSGRPWDYLTQKTSFNKDVIGSEHLIIADPTISTVKDRSGFAQQLKQHAAEEEHRSHHKNLDAMLVKPYQRLSVSANDELHNVIIVPTLEPSFEDKCHVIKCAAAAVPSPGFENYSRTEFEALIRAELPAFLHFLLHEWKVPLELRQKAHCGRFRLDSWHNPELAEMINSQAPEMTLLEVIDESLMLSQGPWNGSAKKLAKDLEALGDQEAQRLSRCTWLISRYLGLLHNHYPTRVFQKNRTGDAKGVWVIQKAPSKPAAASRN